MPLGELVTEPEPVPAKATDNVNFGVKVAVTVTADEMVTVQVPVPAHAPPLHPVNTELLCGAAVSVTDVPLMKLAEHVAPQLIPDGELVTVPEPRPDFVTVNVL